MTRSSEVTNVFAHNQSNSFGIATLRSVLVLAASCLLWLPFHVAMSDDADEYKKMALLAEIQRRDFAEKELNELRARRETLEDRVNFAKKVVLMSFHVEAQSTTLLSKNAAKNFERLRQVRDVTAKGLLEHRDRFKGDIASGKALNFLLQECGPVAFEHAFCTNVLKIQPPAPQGAPLLNQQPPMQPLLRPLVANFQLGERYTRHIQYQRGLTGPKLAGRVNQVPLDMEWVSALRDAAFQPNIKKIKRLRDQAIDELKMDQPVSAKTADGLMDAAHDLLNDVQNGKREQMRRIKEGSARSHEDWQRFNQAEKQVRLLIAGAYRFIEAYRPEDISIETLANSVTVEGLIAFMHENGLTFAPADKNGETSYDRVFELMIAYYVDLLAIENSTRDLTATRAKEYELQQVALGNRMSKYQMGEIAVEALKAAGKALSKPSTVAISPRP